MEILTIQVAGESSINAAGMLLQIEPNTTKDSLVSMVSAIFKTVPKIKTLQLLGNIPKEFAQSFTVLLATLPQIKNLIIEGKNLSLLELMLDKLNITFLKLITFINPSIALQQNMRACGYFPNITGKADNLMATYRVNVKVSAKKPQFLVDYKIAKSRSLKYVM